LHLVGGTSRSLYPDEAPPAKEEVTMATAHPLINHDEVRRWAEERGAKPVCVEGAECPRDPGAIQLDFPGPSGESRLRQISRLRPVSWEEWFEKFDDADLALLVQERTAAGERSNFNRLVARSSRDGN
jgi:hypothetical protein